MSKDRFDELVEKRQLLREEIAECESELREIVLTFGAGTTAVRPAIVRKPQARQSARRVATPSVTDGTVTETTATATAEEEAQSQVQGRVNDEGVRQPSLKEVVQDILSQSQRGMELKEIVAEVTRMITTGEYHSKAKKVTPIVSQALFALKQERLVVVEKSPANNRHLYSLSHAA